jgi:hypothetical protein
MANTTNHPNALTDEGLEMVKAGWLAGQSATELSKRLRKELGIQKTRNAVIGIIHRAKAREEGRQAPRAPRPRAEPRMTRPVRPVAPVTEKGCWNGRLVQPVAPVVLPEKVGSVWPIPTTAKPTLQLGALDCKFPVGPATGMDQLHCGAPREAGDPAYCEAHRLITGGGKKDPADDIRKLRRYAQS